MRATRIFVSGTQSEEGLVLHAVCDSDSSSFDVGGDGDFCLDSVMHVNLKFSAPAQNDVGILQSAPDQNSRHSDWPFTLAFLPA